MKKHVLLCIAAVSFCLCAFTVTAHAQRGMYWKGSRGWGTGSPYYRMYNPKTVDTVSGTVTGIERIVPMRGMSYGIRLTLQANKEKLPVHLGPEWFLENQDMGFETGDLITVKGSRITFDGEPAVIAAEITKNGNVLELRNEYGSPAWSGWRRRGIGR